MASFEFATVSAFSPLASYMKNQAIVIAALVRAGDVGLPATVGARSGSLPIPGQRITGVIQGDIWNGIAKSLERLE